MQIEFKDDAKWLSKFKIDVTSNSNKLYNNGNQQVKVTVSLTPVKGQEITHQQMDSIWIFLIKDGSDYRDLGGSFGRGATDSEWAKNNTTEPEEFFKVSLKKNTQFEYYAASGFAPHNLLESAARSRDFYISTLAHGGERYKIYAAIMKEDGVQYATSTSRFNSHVELETVSFPRKKRSDFTLERVHAYEGHTDAGHTAVDIDVYYLEFADRNLRIIAAEPLDLRPPADADDFYYEDWKDLTLFPGLPRNAESQFHYGFRPGPARDFTFSNISIPVNTRRGAMNFLRMELIGSARTWYGTARGPKRWVLIDQYGNWHGIEMTQKNAGNEVDFRMRDL